MAHAIGSPRPEMHARILFFCLALCLTRCSSAAQSPTEPSATPTTTRDAPVSASSEELARLFAKALDTIESQYVGSIDKQRLAEVALQAMLRELDDHSDFIGRDQWAGFGNDVAGQYEGVGLQLTQIDGKLTALAAAPDSPAEAAGLAKGDHLLAIDGRLTWGMTLDQAVARLSGAPGEQVEIVVANGPMGQPQTLVVPRATVQRRSVWGWAGAPGGSQMWCDQANRIGYLRIAFFGKRTAGEFRQAVLHLVQADAAGLVLDLRGNPGGLLVSALDCADLFIEEGVLAAADRRNEARRVWRAHAPGTVRNLPLALIVDRDTASASETLAACLQDHGRAIIVGEPTFGKQTVQNVFELEPGQTAIKLTSAHLVRLARLEQGAATEKESHVSPDAVAALTDLDRRAVHQQFLEQDLLGMPSDDRPWLLDEQVARAIHEVRARTPGEPMSVNSMPPVEAENEAMEQSLLKRADRRGASW